jgi:hypothetical protein
MKSIAPSECAPHAKTRLAWERGYPGSLSLTFGTAIAASVLNAPPTSAQVRRCPPFEADDAG